jgi:flagellar motor switch protein FliM
LSEILSQSEIDALLESLKSGSDDVVLDTSAPKEAKLYDWKKPQKFGREHTRTLSNIFENFARNVSSYLTGYLRTGVTITIEGCDESSYLDFQVTLMNPVILALLELTPLKGTVIMEDQ